MAELPVVNHIAVSFTSVLATMVSRESTGTVLSIDAVGKERDTDL